MSSAFTRTLFLFGALFFVDRASKVVALYFFSDRAHALFPGFLQLSLFMHAKDFFLLDRAAFSWVGIIFLLSLSAFFLLHKKRHIRPPYYIVIVAAGVASNVLDSIRYGSIIDWIEIPGITFFNLSDIFIIGGCVGLCRTFFFKQSKE